METQLVDYSRLVAKWDLFLKAGHFRSIQEELNNIEFDPQRVPRDMAVSIAKLLRRSGLISESIQLLSPIVNTDDPSEPPTDQEVIEYCQLLERAGVANEALFRLNRISESSATEVLVLKAASNVFNWRYQEAIEKIDQYLSVAVIGDYQRTVVQVNRVSALLYLERYDEAATHIDHLLKTCIANLWNRLLVNCYELQAQLLFFQDDHAGAKASLRAATGIEVSDSSVDKFLLQKWSVIIQYHESGNWSPVEQFIAEARKRKKWELVRDVELHCLKINPTLERIDNLYWGTPFRPFRERIKKLFPEVSREYYIHEKKPLALNLENGELNGLVVLKPGKNTHRLLIALTEDFYKPMKVGTIFNALYPGENYDPTSSTNRVFRTISQARMDFLDCGLEIEIVEKDGEYRIRTGKSLCLRKSETQDQVTAFSVRYRKLYELFGFREFTRKEAALGLNLKPTSALRVIRECQNRGLVSKIGTGKNTFFCFLKNDLG